MSYFGKTVSGDIPMVNLRAKNIDEWGILDSDLAKAYGVISRTMRHKGEAIKRRTQEGLGTSKDKELIAALQISALLIKRYQFKRGIIPKKVEVISGTSNV